MGRQPPLQHNAADTDADGASNSEKSVDQPPTITASSNSQR